MTYIFSFLVGFLAGALIQALGSKRGPAATRAVASEDPAQVTREHLGRMLRTGQINRVAYDSVMMALQTQPSSTAERTPTAKRADESADVVVMAELVSRPKPPERSDTSPPPREKPEQQPSPKPSSVAPEKPRPAAPSTVPVQQRAREYMRRRSAAEPAADRSTQPAQTIAEPRQRLKPRKPWSELFAAFMEEKNIRWGELVGGLLIVSCSVALVISFWESIAAQPLLKFGVLNGVTAALFGIGLHAARHWKLPTTSQGLLITSTLLVPLNFLAIAAFSRSTSTPMATAVIGEAVSVVLFSALVYFGARVISRRWSIPLTIGVMVPSVCQLAIRRQIDATSTVVPLYVLSLVCLLTFAGTCVFVIGRAKKKAQVPERMANELLKHLGIVAFPMLVALGLLLAKSERLPETIQYLSPLSILVASPLLLCGTVLWKRPGASVEGLRLAGSSLAVAGVMVFIAGCIAAWPQPAAIVALTTIGVVCAIWVAIDLEIPEAHWVAAVLLLPAVVLTGHVFAENLTWTGESTAAVIRQCASAQTGRFLTGIAYVGMAISAVLLRLRRADVARCYAAVCVGSALVGLALVGYYGVGRVGDPEHVTLILCLHTVTVIVAAFVLRNTMAMGVGGFLLLAAMFQGLQYGPWEFDFDRPWLVMFLLHATSMTLLAVASKVGIRDESSQDVSRAAWFWSLGTAVMSAITLGLVIAPNLTGAATDPLTGYLAWLAAVWLGLAVLGDSRELFSVFQLTLALALMAGVDWAVHERPWYKGMRFGWLHPTALQCQGIALAAYSLCWVGIRTALRREWLASVASSQWQDRLSDWLTPAWIGIDRWFGILSMGILVFLTIYGVVPGIAQELTPMSGPERIVPEASNYALLDIPHLPAHGVLAWILAAVLLTTQSIALVESPRRWNLTAVVTVASTIPLLLASHWTSTVSVASATRWGCSIFFLMGSVIIWLRRPILSKLREQRLSKLFRRRDLHWFSFGLLLVFSSAPLLAMAAFVALTAVTVQPPDATQGTWLTWLGVICAATLAAFLATSVAPDDKRAGWRTACGSVVVLGTMPLFAMTLFVIGQALASHPIVGPDAASLFARVGLSISYAVPLLLMSVALIGHAISLRAASISFAAGLLLCFSGTAAYLLASKGVDLGEIKEWLRLGQLNSIIATVYSLGWVVMLRGPLRTASVRADMNWLRAQIGVGVGFIALPIAALTIHLGLMPSSSVAIHEAAGLWGWTALALAIGAAVSCILYEQQSISKPLVMVATAAVCAMVALQSQVWDVGPLAGSWKAFHVLQLMSVVVGGMLIGVDRLAARRSVGDQPSQGISICLLGVLGWLVLLGFRGIWGDPQLTSFWLTLFALYAAGMCVCWFRSSPCGIPAQSDR